jgi:hypothetical protein
MTKNALVTAIVAIIGFVMALVLGNLVGSGSYHDLGIVFAGAALLLVSLSFQDRYKNLRPIL